MLELIAQGPEPLQRWRQEVLPGGPYVLGRSTDADFTVPWDRKISRRHLLIQAENRRIAATAAPGASNAVFVGGEPQESFSAGDGGRFAIGDTTFTVRQLNLGHQDRTPVEHALFDSQELRSVRFEDADRRIEVLTRLPEMILGTASTDELYARVVDFVLAGSPRADAAAIVSGSRPDGVTVLHQDRRRQLEGELRPSARLVSAALTSAQSALHVWDGYAGGDSPFTAAAEFDWAFCTPLPLAGTEPTGVYVAGRLDATAFARSDGGTHGIVATLQADVKFAELVAEILRSVLRLNDLERQTAGLRQFLSPPILSALGDRFDAKLLEPRECEATVLFCDLRGFSVKAEGASDDLLGLLERVSLALGVMTKEILRHGGVTGDFLGDAALAFWGWPFGSEDAPLDAARAALAIRREFVDAATRPDHPLRDFRVGIGIAHGPAVAGKIGTPEQVKFTVFGPVVNLASRLEGMTKQLRVPVLIDEATATAVRDRLPAVEGRTRRLARVLPYGSERPLVVSELIPSVHDQPGLTDADLATYEAAVDAFSSGQWDEAYRLLHRLPPDDRAPDFLNQLITAQNRVPPAGWDGIVRLPTK
ncbi:MAG: adenylate/guanylate cyclase domain-containing protein [Planctomycetaceae bacterium]